METTLKTRLKKEALTGAKQGWHSFIWMVEIIVPVSLIMAILQWSGWLGNVNHYLQPAMSFLNLPPEAAFPIISSILINIYAVIAILTIVPFSLGQMTLIAIFALVAHNMIIEGVIQHRSGINFIKASLLRLITAIVLVFIVSRFFSGTVQSITVAVTVTAQPAFLTMLRS
jgi:spore maturation protein SpmB